MEPTGSLIDQVRNWYEHSPTAQRVYTRLRADVDAVVEQARPMMQEFWEKVGPIIDPPPKDAPAPGDDAAKPPGERNS